MKKELFLHIGFGKTGTTSIQSFLNSERINLIDAGILYPEAGQINSGHHLLASLGEHEILEKTVNEYRKIVDEIKASPCQKIIISSENLCFMSEKYVAQIFSLFSEFQTKIIFYVRPQSELIESTYLEWVKAGKKYTRTLAEFFKLHSGGFNFIKRLDPWRRAFGEENIILRCYGENAQHIDSRYDILNVLQVPDKIMELVKNHNNKVLNPSLSPEFCKLIFLIDEYDPDPDTRWEMIKEMLRIAAKLDSKKTNRLMTDGLKAEIDAHYRNSNIELQTIFGKNCFKMEQ